MTVYLSGSNVTHDKLLILDDTDLITSSSISSGSIGPLIDNTYHSETFRDSFGAIETVMQHAQYGTQQGEIFKLSLTPITASNYEFSIGYQLNNQYIGQQQQKPVNTMTDPHAFCMLGVDGLPKQCTITGFGVRIQPAPHPSTSHFGYPDINGPIIQLIKQPIGSGFSFIANAVTPGTMTLTEYDAGYTLATVLDPTQQITIGPETTDKFILWINDEWGNQGIAGLVITEAYVTLNTGSL